MVFFVLYKTLLGFTWVSVLQQGLIRAMCARLGNVQPDGLLEAINDLPSQKKVNELEAKNTFLLEKSKKISDELKEEKEAHKKALDKLNLSLVVGSSNYKYSLTDTLK